MSAPAKFLFDVDFAAPAPAKETARDRAAMEEDTARQVATAEARGYRSGFDAAQREAHAANERRMAAALEQININLGTIAGSFSTIEERMEREAIDVALAVARKLCAEMIAAEPLAEITALVSDCFRHLTSTPHLVVRVNDALYDSARERVETLARQSGFGGRVVILAEPEIEAGDCKIEWADGGVTLDRTAINAKIAELVGRYMASRNQTGLSGREDRS